MVQYLHFRILEFPSKKGHEGTNERLQALEMVEVTTGHQSPEGCAVEDFWFRGFRMMDLASPVISLMTRMCRDVRY